MSVPSGSVKIGPEHGRLVVRTWRAGIAARAGHDLTIEVTQWSAQLDAPGGDPASANLTATIGLDSMVVREGSGGTAPVTDNDRREIERNARKLLNSSANSTAVFQSTRVGAEGDGWVVDGLLTLHDAESPIRLEVSPEGPNRYLARTTITQSRYGIRPYSGFLGALKLRDEVGIEIEVDLS
jgi:polyisoprenoid-binding protein YceI